MRGFWIRAIISPPGWRVTGSQSTYSMKKPTPFAIRWKGNYRLDGNTFIYIDRDTGRMSSIVGYPTRKITELG
jgi:hypothetical protein